LPWPLKVGFILPPQLPVGGRLSGLWWGLADGWPVWLLTCICKLSQLVTLSWSCCTVSENPALSDVYISDDESPAEPVQQSSKVSRPQTTNNKPPTTTPPAVMGKVSNSHKKNEPLPPIPQHHYDQAARQIQQSRHAAPTSVQDDVKMEWVCVRFYHVVDACLIWSRCIFVMVCYNVDVCLWLQSKQSWRLDIIMGRKCTAGCDARCTWRYVLTVSLHAWTTHSTADDMSTVINSLISTVSLSVTVAWRYVNCYKFINKHCVIISNCGVTLCCDAR